MTSYLRGGVLGAALLTLTACAGDHCQYLAYGDNVPQKNRPLVMPDGVPAVPEGGEFRIPDGEMAHADGRCLAEPPMTLDPAVLVEPEEGPDQEEEATGETPQTAVDEG